MGGGGVVIKDFSRNVTILMLKNENTLVELISFLDREKESPIDFLFHGKCKFPGGTPYHICYAVDDLNETITFLKNNKFMVIKTAEKAVALDNKYVAFLFHKDIGIIELCQK
jgi:methylmalonyl-CoA/ethylmalonyl-CoA epimerase